MASNSNSFVQLLVCYNFSVSMVTTRLNIFEVLYCIFLWGWNYAWHMLLYIIILNASLMWWILLVGISFVAFSLNKVQFVFMRTAIFSRIINCCKLEAADGTLLDKFQVFLVEQQVLQLNCSPLDLQTLQWLHGHRQWLVTELILQGILWCFNPLQVCIHSFCLTVKIGRCQF